MKMGGDQADALGPAGPCAPPGDPKVVASPSSAAPVVTVDPAKHDWIGIELRTPDGKPVPGEAFRVELPNGRTITGQLDAVGKVRIEGIDPGTCRITFPDRDGHDWDSEST
jgi:hypothetical protein